MLPIFKTEDLIVEAPLKPHHSRSNGGHIIIFPVIEVEQRYELPLDVAQKLMHLSMIVGEAATNIMRKNGLDVIRGNYQDNGNWAYKPDAEWPPQVHLHIYLRTSDERHPDNDPRFQAFPDAIAIPSKGDDYYDKFEPLTEQDCNEIHDEIIRLLATEKYRVLEINEHV